MRRCGQVIPRDTLIEAVWGYDRNIESNTLDAFIRLLRSKVEGDSGPRLIHTVRGVGYVARREEARNETPLNPFPAGGVVFGGSCAGAGGLRRRVLDRRPPCSLPHG